MIPPPITHVSTDGELKPETIEAINVLAEKAYFMNFRDNDFNALCDSLITKYIKPLHQSLSIESVRYFVESGTVSGGFLVAIRNMLREHGEICEMATQEKKDKS